jgi:hypothetical protein
LDTLFCGGTDQKKTNLSKVYRCNFTARRFHTTNLTFTSFARKPHCTTITLILITPASITGFLNSGLKRLGSRLNPYWLGDITTVS